MTGVLLDTHTLIWMVADENKLGDHARDILDSELRKWMSPVNYWEMAIKIKLGKLVLASDYDEFFEDMINMYALDVLHIEPRHTSLLTTLPLYHKDPFDRLLIAQAVVEEMPIISVDTWFDSYQVERIWQYADSEMDAAVEEEESDD